MNFFIIVLVICLFISLFCIYILSRDDHIFLRKDVAMDKLFNLAFLDFVIGLLFARAFFVLFHSSKMFINPLVFFLFPYFPGLSLAGGVLGGLGFLIFYASAKGFPLGRIFDFFSISFLASLPLGYLGFFILTGGKNIFSIILAIAYLCLLLIFIKYFYQLLLKGTLKDGSLGLIFFLLFSLGSVSSKIIEGFSKVSFIREPENYLFLVLFIVCIFLFIKQERVIKFRRR